MGLERFSNAALLGIGIGLGAAGMWLLLGRSPGGAAQEAPRSAALAPATVAALPEAPADAGRQILEGAPAAEPDPAPASDSGLPIDTALPSPYPRLDASQGQPIQPWMWKTLGPTPRLRTPDSEFSAKYPESLSAKELDKLWSQMLRECTSEAFEIGCERQQLGHYEEVLIPVKFFEDGKGFELRSDDWIEPKQDYGPEYDAYPYKNIRPPYPPHRNETRVMWVPFDEFPELYRREDEALYLRRRAGIARAAEKAAPGAASTGSGAGK